MSEGSKRAINMVKQAQTQKDHDDPWYRHEQKNERMVTKEDLLTKKEINRLKAENTQKMIDLLTQHKK